MNDPHSMQVASRPSVAFLIPFIIAVFAYTACTAIGGRVTHIAPLMASAITLYLTCVFCATMSLEEAGMAASGALGVLAGALFALPFLVSANDGVLVVWLAASNLGLIAMFAAETIVRTGVFSGHGRKMATAVMVQSALITVVFVIGSLFATLVFTVVLLLHSLVLRKLFATRTTLPAAAVRNA